MDAKENTSDRYSLRGDDEHGWEVIDNDTGLPVRRAQPKHAAEFAAAQLNGHVLSMDD